MPHDRSSQRVPDEARGTSTGATWRPGTGWDRPPRGVHAPAFPDDEAPAHVPSWLGEVARQAAVRGEIIHRRARELRRKPGWTPESVKEELDALSLSLRGGISHEAWVNTIRREEMARTDPFPALLPENPD